MSHFLISIPPHGSKIANENGTIHPSYQISLDDLAQKLNDHVFGEKITLESYTVGTLPSASGEPGLIYVSDESGGAVPAFSDGTNWRRVTDRAVVA